MSQTDTSASQLGRHGENASSYAGLSAPSPVRGTAKKSIDRRRSTTSETTGEPPNDETAYRLQGHCTGGDPRISPSRRRRAGKRARAGTHPTDRRVGLAAQRLRLLS